MKKVAPIIISILMVFYLGAYAYILLFMTDEAPAFIRWVIIIAGLIVLGVLGAVVYTLVKRLKEIDQEEDDDDDLSQY